jgi:membrane-associated protease RseP (regulator of RpoE activity)
MTMRFKNSLIAVFVLASLTVVASAQRLSESVAQQKAAPRQTPMPMLTEDKATIPTLKQQAGKMPTLVPPGTGKQLDSEDVASRPSALGVDLINTPRGPMVQAVYVESPASEADLRTGDLIVGIDGVNHPSIAALASAISRIAPGEQVTIDISRGGQSIRTTTTLVDREDSFGAGQRRVPERYLTPHPTTEPGDELEQMQYQVDSLKEQVATLRREMIVLQDRVRALSIKEEPQESTHPPHGGAIIDRTRDKNLGKQLYFVW